MAHYPARERHGLAADGSGRRRAGARPPRPALRRRPAHHRGPRRPRRGRASRGEEIRLWADPGDVGDRPRPDLHAPAPSPTGCGGARCAPATTSSGTRATSSSRAPTPGTYTVGGDDPRGRRLGRPAGPLVGHPRPWPLPAVACGSRSSSTTGSSACGTGSCPNGAPVYTDGCWAGTDGSDPIPVVDFEHDVAWLGAEGKPAEYGEHGEDVAGLAGPMHVHARRRAHDRGRGRGHLRPPVRAVPPRRPQPDDGSAPTTAARAPRIYEVTGARHHRYFPATSVAGVLRRVTVERRCRSPTRPSALTPEWLTARSRPAGTWARPGSWRRRSRRSAPARCATACGWRSPTTARPRRRRRWWPSCPAADPTSRATALAMRSYEKEVRFYQELAPDPAGPHAPACYHADIDPDDGQLRAAARGPRPGRAAGDQLAGCTPDEPRPWRSPSWSACTPPAGATRRSPRSTGCTATRAEGRRDVHARHAPDVVGRVPASATPTTSAPTSTSGRRAVRRHRGLSGADAEPPGTVVHGDYRLDNLLFDRRPRPGWPAVVDWQTCALGPGARRRRLLHRRRPRPPTTAGPHEEDSCATTTPAWSRPGSPATPGTAAGTTTGAGTCAGAAHGGRRRR